MNAQKLADSIDLDVSASIEHFESLVSGMTQAPTASSKPYVFINLTYSYGYGGINEKAFQKALKLSKNRFVYEQWGKYSTQASDHVRVIVYWTNDSPA